MEETEKQIPGDEHSVDKKAQSGHVHLPAESIGRGRDALIENVDAIIRKLKDIESRLKSCGPDVDFPAIYAYIGGDLPERIAQEIERRIYTWKDWFRVYYKLRSEVESIEVDTDVLGGK